MSGKSARRIQYQRHPLPPASTKTAAPVSRNYPATSCSVTTTRIMNYSHAKFRIFITLYWVVLSVADAEIILRVDPLALLSATLRTYQKAACDTDQVVIACPRGTSISIEFAQYNKFIAKDGISIEELCRTDTMDITQGRAKAKHLLRGSTFGSPSQQVPANRYVNNAYGLYNVAVAQSAAAAAAASSATAAGSAQSSTINAGDNDNTNNNKNNNNHTTTSTADGQQKTDANELNSADSCMWPNALQYSLLQTVVEACQKKKHCKFNGAPQYYGQGASGVGDASGTSSYYSSTASSGAISVDPCPKRRKIVEVAYKCRPYEFRSKVACHNDVAQLECNPYSRIAVYSASFGRTEYESIQCPQPQGVREETCLASYATETVMQICHGRRRCNLAADANTFGSPCQPNSRMYLKVVYTCVPKQVLKDRYESDVESDEPEDFEGDLNDLYDEDLHYKESEAIPKLYSNTTTITSTASQTNATVPANSGPLTNGGVGSATSNTSSLYDADTSGGVNPVMTHSADLSLEDDQERLYLYLLIAGFAGVIVCIIIVAVRVLVVQKRDGISGTSADTHSMSSTKQPGQGGAGGAEHAETTIPNGFNDTISEIDADIDLTVPIPVPSVSKNENYSLYGPSTTTSLYGSAMGHHGPHNSSTLLLQSGSPVTSAGGGASGGTGLIANPLLCGGTGIGVGVGVGVVGARQSPDIIGISSNAFVTSSGHGEQTLMAQGPVAGLLPLPPGLVIGSGMGGMAGGSTVVSSTPMSCNSSALGTVVPFTSLAQYTTAPTFRAGYIIHPEGVLQRATTSPLPTATPNAVTCLNQLNQQQLQQFQQQQQQQLQQQQQQQQQQLPLPLPPQSSVTTTTTMTMTTPSVTSNLNNTASSVASSPSLSTTITPNSQLTTASSTSTLRRTKHPGVSLLQQHQQPSYDGTAPRTLSTGVPVNSQFYYG